LHDFFFEITAYEPREIAKKPKQIAKKPENADFADGCSAYDEVWAKKNARPPKKTLFCG